MAELQPAVELVLEGLAPDRRAALARAGRVAALQHELGDEPVEDRAVVVALERKLYKVAARLRRLLGPKLDVDVAEGRVQDHLALRRRLGRVVRRHRRIVAPLL